VDFGEKNKAPHLSLEQKQGGTGAFH